jgi:hypothetical protein
MRKAILAIAACAVLSGAVAAQTPADKLVAEYRDFAGSEAGARALVAGLSEKMSYEDIGIALALARASLEEQDITGPTPRELQTALLGGSVMRRDGMAATLPGVLEMRAGGMGWSEIAHTLGYKLPIQKPQ